MTSSTPNTQGVAGPPLQNNQNTNVGIRWDEICIRVDSDVKGSGPLWRGTLIEYIRHNSQHSNVIGFRPTDVDFAKLKGALDRELGEILGSPYRLTYIGEDNTEENISSVQDLAYAILYMGKAPESNQRALRLTAAAGGPRNKRTSTPPGKQPAKKQKPSAAADGPETPLPNVSGSQAQGDNTETAATIKSDGDAGGEEEDLYGVSDEEGPRGREKNIEGSRATITSGGQLLGDNAETPVTIPPESDAGGEKEAPNESVENLHSPPDKEGPRGREKNIEGSRATITSGGQLLGDNAETPVMIPPESDAGGEKEAPNEPVENLHSPPGKEGPRGQEGHEKAIKVSRATTVLSGQQVGDSAERPVSIRSESDADSEPELLYEPVEERSGTPDEEVPEGEEKDIEESRARITAVPAINHESDEEWQRCCAFFKINPKDRVGTNKVKIEGMNTKLFIYQLYAVWWMLGRPTNGVSGGFLCDTMGLGKTITSLAFVVISRWLAIAKSEIVLARASRDSMRQKAHLKSGESGRKCPTDPYPFSCPCEAGSDAEALMSTVRYGPVLLVAPPGLVSMWWDQIKLHVRVGHPKLQMEVFYQYGSKKEETDRALPYTRLRDLQARIEVFGKELRYNTSAQQTRYIVLTSPMSLQEHVQKRLSLPDPRSRRGAQVQGVAWSVMIRDEYHKDKGKDTVASSYFCSAVVKGEIAAGVAWQPNDPIRWALTGTPWEISPSDLEAHINALEDNTWGGDKAGPLFKCTAEALKERAKEYHARVAAPQNFSRAEMDSFTQNFTKLLAPLMIRRDTEDSFFGTPISTLPPRKIQEIVCVTDERHLQALAQLATKGREVADAQFNAQVAAWERHRRGTKPVRGPFLGGDHYFILRLCASFPAIAQLRSEHPDWTFKADEISRLKLYKSEENQDASLYGQNLARLVRHSDKINQLERKLRALTKKKTAPLDKMLLFSFSPAITLVLAMWFRRFSKVKAFLLHPEMSTADRAAAIRSFQLTEPEPSMNQDAYDAQVLIAQTVVGGTGHTILRARFVGMFDLEYRWGDMNQAFSRIHRPGQTQELVFFLMYNMGNPVEIAIRNRQTNRRATTEQTFAVTTGEAEKADYLAAKKSKKAATQGSDPEEPFRYYSEDEV